MNNIENKYKDVIIGEFTGKIGHNGEKKYAHGYMEYSVTVNGESKDVTVPVNGVRIRKLQNPDDEYVGYVKIQRGSEDNIDKIIGFVTVPKKILSHRKKPKQLNFPFKK